MSYQNPRGFLAGIDPRHFMDTHAEFHAFAQGFCEVLCPWPPRHAEMSEDLKKQVTDDHHYYMFGRAAGILAWLIIIITIKEVFF